ncbi:ATP synthase subunit I [Paenibacillus sp. FA6]|uniref:ATP synthase subunit I n=1 Tax=Paenibacillus sp. FA6 TaxID=3413029 RepID=UPI003F65BBDC
MDNTISIVKTVTRLSLLMMSALLVCWVLCPDYRTVTMGMVLGMVVGLVNTSYLSMKIRNLAQAIANNQRQFGIGFLTRLSFSILVVMFSVKIEHFSLGATIAGLFIPQVLTVPVAIYLSMRKKKS